MDLFVGILIVIILLMVYVSMVRSEKLGLVDTYALAARLRAANEQFSPAYEMTHRVAPQSFSATARPSAPAPTAYANVSSPMSITSLMSSSSERMNAGGNVPWAQFF